jgi:hypothetical protein
MHTTGSWHCMSTWLGATTSEARQPTAAGAGLMAGQCRPQRSAVIVPEDGQAPGTPGWDNALDLSFDK